MRTILDGQKDKLKEIDSRQKVLEEQQMYLQSSLEKNLRQGVDHIEFLHRSTEGLFRIVESSGKHLEFLASVFEFYKGVMDRRFGDQEAAFSQWFDRIKRDLQELLNTKLNRRTERLRNDLCALNLEQSQRNLRHREQT